MRLRTLPLQLRVKTFSHEVVTSASFLKCRRPSLMCLVPMLLLAMSAALAKAQYTSIVVFGDSLSDVGNDTLLTAQQVGLPIPSPIADYTLGSFTDGPDTAPMAHKFFGVWVQQLAAMMPGVPILRPSLAGGTDYAYGFAETGNGTIDFTFGKNDVYGVNVDNVGLQISTYLASHPKITKHTLFVVWGGAINVLYANNTGDVLKGATAEIADVQRLIDAGATHIIVPNLPPLGDTPRLNGYEPANAADHAAANEASVLFNDTLDVGLDVLPIINFFRGVHIYKLDVYGLFNHVLTSPSVYSLANVTTPSQGEPVDPDTYLFWDDLHPTTRGHNIIALDALKLVDPAACAAMPTTPGDASCEALPLYGSQAR